MFQPIITGNGIAGYNLLRSSLDTQIDRMVAFPLHAADEEYFKENIGNISTAEELVSDRRLLEVVLSRFGLQDEADKPAFIQRVLEEGTSDAAAMANRLPDRRYRELTNALGFGPGAFSPLQLNNPEYSSFSSFVSTVIRDDSYLNSASVQDEEVMRFAEPANKLLGLIDNQRSRLSGREQVFRLSGFDIVGDRNIFSGAREDIEADLQRDILEDDDLKAFLLSAVDTSGFYTSYGAKLGGEYDIVRPVAFNALSEDAQARALEDWKAGEVVRFSADGEIVDFVYDGFEGANAADSPSEMAALQESPIYQSNADYNRVVRLSFEDLSEAGQQRALEQLNAYQFFSEDGLILDIDSVEQSPRFEFEDLDEDTQNTVLVGALQTLFEPNRFSFMRLSNDSFMQKLVDASIANSPVEASGIVSRDQLASNRFDAFVDDMLQGFRRQEFELAVGNQSNSLRVALFAERALPEIAELDTTERGKWFSILGNPPLRQAFQTALNLPTQFASIDIDVQLETLQERSSSIWGLDSPDQMSDPEMLDSIIRRYLLMEELTNGAVSSSSGASTALTLLQSANLSIS